MEGWWETASGSGDARQSMAVVSFYFCTYWVTWKGVKGMDPWQLIRVRKSGKLIYSKASFDLETMGCNS